MKNLSVPVESSPNTDEWKRYFAELNVKHSDDDKNFPWPVIERMGCGGCVVLVPIILGDHVCCIQAVFSTVDGITVAL